MDSLLPREPHGAAASPRYNADPSSHSRWAQLARQALAATGAVVVVLEGDSPTVCGSAGDSAGAETGARLLADHELRSLLLAAELVVDDMRNDLRTRALASTGALAAVALRDPQGQLLGVLVVTDSRRRAWTETDLQLLRGAAAAAETDLALQRETEARQRAEAAAQRNQHKFDAIFDNTGVGITLLGADGWLIRSNQVLQRMLGAGEVELRTRRLSEYAHPDDLPEMLAALERLSAGAEDQSLELRLCRADRQTLWVHVVASVVRDSEGRPLFGIAMVDDVTQRRVAEEALQESQRQLLLSQRMESVGRLAGGIAHDFNNMLTAIGSFAQLLEADLRPQGEIALYISEIRKATTRAATLTRQLLAYSRQQILKPSRLSLNQSVWELEGMLRRIIGENLELVTDLEPSLNPVLADPGQIEQVLMNLVVNARDAMPEGGRVTIRTRSVEITPEQASAYPYSVTPGPYVCLTVSDTGLGMDADTLGRIFDPFFTTKEQGKGTGLGLSTVYGIVKQSGGYIWVTSEPGQGATFELYLPRLLEEVDERAEPERPERPRGGSETILLAEDEETVRTLADRILTRRGYRVLTASSGAEALSLYEAHAGEIQLLLTDVVMPGMSGRTLAQRLLTRAPKLPVVFMSGYTADAIERDGVLEPGTAFLEKPFSPDSLAAIVRSALDRAVGV